MDVSQAIAIYHHSLDKAQSSPHPEDRARKTDFIEMYWEGHTLNEIGNKHGITREAVRQNLLKLSAGAGGSLKEAHKVYKQHKLEEQAKLNERQALLWSHQNPGAPLTQAEALLGIAAKDLRKYLKERLKYHPKPTHETKRGGKQRWSNEQILDMIRQCKEETGKITSDAFQKWSVARGGPTKQTPTIRFGTWAAAVQAAGIEGTYSVERKRAYDETDLWAAVIEYCHSPAFDASHEGYDRWQQATGHRPSGALLRQRLQLPWPELTATALRISQGNFQGLDEDWVAQVLQPRDWAMLLEEARTEINLDELIPAAMKDQGDYLTTAIYDQWAENNNKPVAVRLMAATGKKWAEIVLPYGGRVGTRGRRGTMTDEEVLAGLQVFVIGNADHRYETYQQWARLNHYPSPSMLAKRFGSYTQALEKVQNKGETSQ